jgi:tetratricopeptide (TPR) repeat protein
MMQQSDRTFSAAATIMPDIASLLALLQAQDVGDAQLRDLISLLMAQLQDAAAGAEGYGPVLELLARQQGHLRRLLDLLTTAQADLETQARMQARRTREDPEWWSQARHAMATAFAHDTTAAAQRWIALYTWALVDGRVDICRALVDDLAGYPAASVPSAALFVDGTEALQHHDYGRALPLLTFLAETDLDVPADEQRGLRGLLHLFAGRISVRDVQRPLQAQAHFNRARDTMPGAGRPLAAHGYLALWMGDHQNAPHLFSQALERSPEQPDGYVGMALFAEAQAWWSDALDWYDQAVDTVENDADAIRSLSRLRAPGGGGLYLQLARRLHRQERREEALRAVERAVTLGLQGEGNYPERIAHRLRGEILLAQGKIEEAAHAFLTAGQQYYWRHEYETAHDLFDRACALAAQLSPLPRQLVQSYWYGADTLRLLSHTPKPPYVVANIAQAALTAWQAGAQRQLPQTPEDSWAFLARAFIEEELGRPLTDTPQKAHWWRALLYVERALIFDTGGQCLTLAGRYQRLVDLPWNALVSTERALERDPSDVRALAERAAILIDVGDYHEADGLVTQLLERLPEDRSYYSAWRALIRFYQGAFQDALEHVNISVAASPDDRWYREIRASCYQALDMEPEARAEWTWLWERQQNPTYTESLLLRSQTAFALGHVQESRRLAEAMLATEPDAFEGRLTLALCALALSELTDASTHFDAALQQATMPRQLDTAQFDLAQLARRLQTDAWAQQAGRHRLAVIRACIADFQQRLDDLRPQVQTLDRSMIAELEQVRDREMAAGRSDSVAWLVAQVGLGRLYREAQRWHEALHIYGALAGNRPDFAESEQGVRNTLEAMLGAGAAEMRQHRFESAVDLFEQVLTNHIDSADTDETVDLYARLAAALIGCGRTDVALRHMTSVLEHYRQRDQSLEVAGSRLGQLLAQHVANAAHYWQLDEVLAAPAATEAPLAAAFAVARGELGSYLETFFSLSGHREMLPLVTPIVIELAKDLVPAEVDEHNTDTWPLFGDYLPAMRRRIEQEMGLRVPAARVRSNEADAFPASTYGLLLDETPLTWSTVPTGRVFCAESEALVRAAGVPSMAISSTIHPKTSAPACWVDAAHAEQLEQAALTVWQDPLLYIIHHLEGLLHQHLADFMGVQEVHDTLEGFASNPERRWLVARALPDETARLRFGHLLRALLAEHVPIVSLEVILEVVRTVGLPGMDVHEALRAVRLALKEQLPGNRAGVQRLAVPAAVEQSIAAWVVTEEKKRYLTIPPEVAQPLLEEIKQLLGRRTSAGLVLVVRNGDLRLFLRRFVQPWYPDLLVMAEDELTLETASAMETTTAAGGGQ